MVARNMSLSLATHHSLRAKNMLQFLVNSNLKKTQNFLKIGNKHCEKELVGF